MVGCKPSFGSTVLLRPRGVATFFVIRELRGVLRQVRGVFCLHKYAVFVLSVSPQHAHNKNTQHKWNNAGLPALRDLRRAACCSRRDPWKGQAPYCPLATAAEPPRVPPCCPTLTARPRDARYPAAGTWFKYNLCFQSTRLGQERVPSTDNAV